MNKRLITLFTALFIVLQIIACRFTVREIGFSSLAHDTYSLVIIDSKADPDDQQYKDLRYSLKDSNIKLVILDPAIDKTHPAALAARNLNMPFPAMFLMSPDERILPLGDSSLQIIVEDILYSPVRTHFTEYLANSFAFIVLTECRDEELNKLAGSILQQNCIDITDRIPNMPKQVDNGPVILTIKPSDFNDERIWLWALGIDSVPEEPLATVMFGRGRIIGDIIKYDKIVSNQAFRLMAMIGADCECGIDRKWMLGKQIPINWSAQTKQSLSDELGFDVDNPMIMAEMSHILLKDPISDQNTEITFAPEEFDLDKIFNEPGRLITDTTQNRSRQKNNPLWIVLIVSVIILATGTLMFFKKHR